MELLCVERRREKEGAEGERRRGGEGENEDVKGMEQKERRKEKRAGRHIHATWNTFEMHFKTKEGTCDVRLNGKACPED